MKVVPFIIVLIASGALWALGAQDPATSNLEQRVNALEAQLAEQRKRVDKQEELIHATVEYLDRQSRAAEDMLSTLDRSEAEGFTAGINYRSRELLLAGWRSHLREVKKDLPGTQQPNGNGRQNGG